MPTTQNSKPAIRERIFREELQQHFPAISYEQIKALDRLAYACDFAKMEQLFTAMLWALEGAHELGIDENDELTQAEADQDILILHDFLVKLMLEEYAKQVCK